LSLAAGAGWVGYTRLVCSRPEPNQATTTDLVSWPSDDPDVLFSAPGVTEPASRTIQIFCELPGTIGKMYVQAGDRIQSGQLLFELLNDTQQAEVSRCEAQVARARAELDKLESWERPEDRQMAKGQWEEAKALLDRAQFEQQRVEVLKASSAVSDKEFRLAANDVVVAQARTTVARARYDRAEAGPRPEEIALARAQVAEAESLVQVARTTFEKTRVRSPIDGMVIYRFREPGESVFPNVPAPVLSIGNREVLNIRADVDEMDLARVKVGQRVFATCDAFGDKRFYGRVVQIAQTLGRKNFRTDRPTEKADTKILEVLIALDSARELPVELQMSIWFLRDQADGWSAAAPSNATTPAIR
jgi:HlyD family secretion protein